MDIVDITMYSANINRRPRSFIDIAVQVLRLKIYPRSEIFLEGKEEKEEESALWVLKGAEGGE